METRFIDFIDLVNQLFDFLLWRTKGSIQIEGKGPLQRRVAFLNICHCLVENNGNIIGTGILDDIGPTGSFLEVEHIDRIIERGFFQKCRNITILSNQLCTALFKLITGKL